MNDSRTHGRLSAIDDDLPEPLAAHCSRCGTQPRGCIAACTRTDCPMRAEAPQKVAA